MTDDFVSICVNKIERGVKLMLYEGNNKDNNSYTSSTENEILSAANKKAG